MPNHSKRKKKNRQITCKSHSTQKKRSDSRKFKLNELLNFPSWNQQFSFKKKLLEHLITFSLHENWLYCSQSNYCFEQKEVINKFSNKNFCYYSVGFSSGFLFSSFFIHWFFVTMFWWKIREMASELLMSLH